MIDPDEMSTFELANGRRSPALRQVAWHVAMTVPLRVS
jgi:hypothetical protein